MAISGATASRRRSSSVPGAEELARYGGTFRPGTVKGTLAVPTGDMVVRLADGEQLTTPSRADRHRPDR